MKTPQTIVPGKANGDGMVVRYETARGTEVFGLAVPTVYANEDWDLGPTWCYLLPGARATLIDTGRPGMFEVLVGLLNAAGRKPADIGRVIITHGHEDHDGNLTQVLAATGAELWAHEIFHSMISYHDGIDDGAPHPDMPGSCRLCYMPDKFSINCLPYHRERSRLKVDVAISDNDTDGGLRFVSTPGHSPDSICIILDGEVIFTGDTVLPDITPHPSLRLGSRVNRRVLPEKYRSGDTPYGLMAYIRSMHRIVHLEGQPLAATLPGHRLFYGGRFNIIHSSAERAREIVRFHIDRCRAILDIISTGPATADEIAARHFPPRLLRGSGKGIARNEITAHLEVMEECGDIRRDTENGELVRPTGSSNYLGLIGAYLAA